MIREFRFSIYIVCPCGTVNTYTVRSFFDLMIKHDERRFWHCGTSNEPGHGLTDQTIEVVNHEDTNAWYAKRATPSTPTPGEEGT